MSKIRNYYGSRDPAKFIFGIVVVSMLNRTHLIPQLMRHLIYLFVIFNIGLFTNSCTVSVNEPAHTFPVSVNNTLHSHELWYVAINETVGYGSVPFLQKAFTISFVNGVLYANNNLVGFGATGNGLGIDVGYYNAYNTTLEVSHDIDGYWNLEVFQHTSTKIELYHPPTNTSYFLYGHHRNTFDYDLVFYDNITYFLQEYEAWEKIATIGGAPTDFDAENFIQFLTGGNNDQYRSSQDMVGTPTYTLYWDYSGTYTVANFNNTNYVKALLLDYDYFADEYFELRIITDGMIELYHPMSGTIYRFAGRNFIQFLKDENGALTTKTRVKTNRDTLAIPASDKK